MSTDRRNRVHPPNDWLAGLCRDGYYACNLGPLRSADLLSLARDLQRLGENLVPGPVVDLKYLRGSPHVTLTRSAVPFHNDGAYRRVPPRYLVLYCKIPPSRGGDTLLVRGDKAVLRLDPSTRDILKKRLFHITLEGCSARRRLLLKHPREGTSVLFFPDPTISANFCVSAARGVPVQQVLNGVRALVADARLTVFRQRWKRHDLLVFDNYKVLHARTAYKGERWLKRLEIFPSSQ